jgi:uncharacterized RDD family membrane protein YckC
VLATALNGFFGFVTVYWLSKYLMELAALIIGENVAWPQMTFMSAYPDDAKNGYFIFVFSVYFVVYVFSGLIGGIAGASPGKYLLDIRYVTRDPHASLFYQMTVRSALTCIQLVPIFLFGPIIGFIFGGAANPVSLLCLCFGLYLWVARTLPNEEAGSWLDARAGVLPVLVTQD